MRYLLAFLYRNRAFLLFLLLQVAAFILIYRSRSFQRASILNSSGNISGSILEKYDRYHQYLDLAEQNENLASENARLRALLKNSYLPFSKNEKEKTDTIYKLRYTYVHANVLNSSFLKTRNFITIDKGTLNGIQKNMGVIGPDGAVGIVHNVSDHFATVIPLINPGISISGTFKNKDYFGPVNWKDRDYRYITLSDIPRYARISKGDTILTDQRSLTFPAGIMIGTVESSSLQQDQNFLSVKVRLSTDFSALQNVYVVKDKMKLELSRLEETTYNQSN